MKLEKVFEMDPTWPHQLILIFSH